MKEARMRATWVKLVVMGLVVLASLGLGAGAWAQAEFQTEQWAQVRQSLFGSRPIDEAGGVIQLDVPLRPDDAGAVPVSIKTMAPQSPERFVKRIVIVIDKNPEPLAAVFHLTRETGLATLETEMRVDTHSPVRAIAETADGKLYMQAKMVKAAGGCAALPVLDADIAAAAARIGQMQIRVPETVVRNEPNRLQLIVNHPNYTGFQMHPIKLYPISAYYVTNVAVSYDGKPILTAETTIANSSDPSFRFFFVPPGPGTLKAEVKDSRGQTFAKSLEVVTR
jgi:sulfur-oxidizing protein SoxY